jgi:hypothetical protein
MLMTREEAEKLLQGAKEAHARGYAGCTPEEARGHHLIFSCETVEAVQNLFEVSDITVDDVICWLEHGGNLPGVME